MNTPQKALRHRWDWPHFALSKVMRLQFRLSEKTVRKSKGDRDVSFYGGKRNAGPDLQASCLSDQLESFTNFQCFLLTYAVENALLRQAFGGLLKGLARVKIISR